MRLSTVLRKLLLSLRTGISKNLYFEEILARICTHKNLEACSKFFSRGYV